MNVFRRLSQGIRVAGRNLLNYRKFLTSPSEAPKRVVKKVASKAPTRKKKATSSNKTKEEKTPRRKSKKQLAEENKTLERENRRLREGQTSRRTAEPTRTSKPASETPQRQRYPYLVAGSRNAFSPDNLTSVYPTKEIALEKYNELLRGGFNESMLAVWAKNSHRFELYVGYERKGSNFIQAII